MPKWPYLAHKCSMKEVSMHIFLLKWPKIIGTISLVICTASNLSWTQIWVPSQFGAQFWVRTQIWNIPIVPFQIWVALLLCSKFVTEQWGNSNLKRNNWNVSNLSSNSKLSAKLSSNSNLSSKSNLKQCRWPGLMDIYLILASNTQNLNYNIYTHRISQVQLAKITFINLILP